MVTIGGVCLAAAISWCAAGGERWGEMGFVCHLDPAQRKPVMCVCGDKDGNPAMPINSGGLICSIPDGFFIGH